LVHLMLKDHHAVFNEVRGIDAKTAIAVTIVGSPKSQKPTSRGTQRLGARLPSDSTDLCASARQIRRKFVHRL